MTIEPNKFYRTRDGDKIRVYATDGFGDFRIHGAVHRYNGWQPSFWTITGGYLRDMDSGNDIISEWVDAPEIDWPSMPAWFTHVARDRVGSWYGYDQKPSIRTGSWETSDYIAYRIRSDYYPKFSGDWKESLCERPSPKTV